MKLMFIRRGPAWLARLFPPLSPEQADTLRRIKFPCC